LPEGAIFNTSSPGIFAKSDLELLVAAAFMNASISSYVLRAIQPAAQHLGEGYVPLVPMSKTALRDETVVSMVEVCISLKQVLCQSVPTEVSFRGCDLELSRTASSRSLPRETLVSCLLHATEAQLSALVVASLDIGERELADVASEVGSPTGAYPLVLGYDGIPEVPTDLRSIPASVIQGLSKQERRTVSTSELAQLKRRLKYLYESGGGATPDESLCESAVEVEESDEPSGGSRGIPSETFLEELSRNLRVHPISLYWLLQEMYQEEGLVCPPELKRQMEDYASVSLLRLLGYRWPEQNRHEAEHGSIIDPDLVDDDGIIPLVPCGNHRTAEELIRIRLERDFGEEGAEHSLKEFRQWVGRDLGDWLRREFFKRHVQQFKQRPIAWHLVSPNRTFEAFLLYHKLSRETLQRLRAQYAGGVIERLRADQERARTRGSGDEVTQLQLQIEDVEEFRSRIEKIERGDELKYRIRCRWKGEEATGRPGPYAPDIDDGVKVNIRPFQEAGVLAVKQVIKKW